MNTMRSDELGDSSVAIAELGDDDAFGGDDAPEEKKDDGMPTDEELDEFERQFLAELPSIGENESRGIMETLKENVARFF
jgi:hypothetical protein